MVTQLVKRPNGPVRWQISEHDTFQITRGGQSDASRASLLPRTRGSRADYQFHQHRRVRINAQLGQLLPALLLRAVSVSASTAAHLTQTIGPSHAQGSS